MRVYLVLEGEYEDRGVTHVVATEELAVRYAREGCPDVACAKRHDEGLHGDEFWPAYDANASDEAKAERLKLVDAYYEIFCSKGNDVSIRVWEVEGA